MIKLVYICLVVFLLMNSFIMSSSFAANFTNSAFRIQDGPKTKLGATALMLLIRVAQVGVAGYFTISLTITGIQYFTVASVSPDEKAKTKNKLMWTFIRGVLAYLGIYLFSYAIGL